MSQLGRLLLAAAFTAALAGCASTLTTQVTAFHPPELTSDWFKGRTFAVQPAGQNAAGPEFATYARSVGDALAARGMVPADAASADLLVGLSWAVAPGSSSAPVGSSGGLSIGSGFGFGGGGSGVMLGVGVPLGAVGGGAVNYRRDLRMTIDRTRATAGGETRLYEAVATSEGRDPTLAPVLPAMVQALFDEFPAPNGQTRVVRARD